MSMIESQLQDLETLKAFIVLKCNADVTCEEARKPLKTIDVAISTIKELSAKLHAESMERSSMHYNSGWIPCEEAMPKERESIFAKFKGTPKWDKNMFCTISCDVIVAIKTKDKVSSYVAHTTDGKWKSSALEIYRDAKVIAWQPLPEFPYQPKESEGKDGR